MTMHQSHIWVGQFKDDAPADYFTDNRNPDEDEADEDVPMNLFAQEQGQLWFSYDFTEISFLDWDQAQPPRAFIDGHSYSESNLDQVTQLCESMNIEKINVFVIADDDEFAAPKTVVRPGYRLTYLGMFDCDG